MGSNTSAPVVNNEQGTLTKPYEDMSLKEKIIHHTKNAINDPVGTAKKVADGATKGVSYIGKATMAATNTANAANAAVNNLRSVGKNTVEAINATHRTLKKSLTDVKNNIKGTTSGIPGAGEKKIGGVLETLIYGEENNSPQFYKPNNAKTILVVILFLLLIIVLIVMYYYSTGQIESFSITNLFSRRKNLYRK